MKGTPALYQFSSLPRITREEAMAMNLLTKQIGFVADSALQSSLAQTCKTLADSDLTFTLSHLGFVFSQQLKQQTASESVCLIFSCGQDPHLGVLQIDLSLAKKMIYAALGSEATSTPENYPLTEIELGILTFFVVRLLSVAQEILTGPFISSIQMLSLGDQDAVLLELENTNARYLSITLQSQFKEAVGLVQLFLPTVSLADNLLQLKNAPAPQPTVLDRIATVKLQIIANVGQVTLMATDMASLEVDDIIVLEGQQVHLKPTGLAGPIMCQLGEEEFATFWGTLLLTKNGRYAISLTHITFVANASSKEILMTKPAPPQEPATSPEPSHDDDEATVVNAPALAPVVQDAVKPAEINDTDDLLQTIKTPLVVELGRASFSLLEIAQMKPGTIIELSRMPSEPVDLVVSGKSIGKGELLDIEGELGVRVLSLTK